MFVQDLSYYSTVHHKGRKQMFVLGLDTFTDNHRFKTLRFVQDFNLLLITIPSNLYKTDVCPPPPKKPDKIPGQQIPCPKIPGRPTPDHKYPVLDIWSHNLPGPPTPTDKYAVHSNLMTYRLQDQ